jgi:peptidoglycan/xylan/chitin deacetylase (PgdA/CDA1 family)
MARATIMSKRIGILVAAAAVAVAGAGALVWRPPDWLLDHLATRYPGCLYRVPTQQRFLALTLDDGPDPESTPQILSVLRRYRSRATFFLITGRLAGQEELVRTIIDDGHELGNHFTEDRPSIQLPQADFERDLQRAHRALTPFAPVRWARPGSGWYSQAMVKAIQNHGYRCAAGSIYPFDAAIPSTAWATRYILRNARPGRIVVLHDGGARGRRTALVLAQVLPELRRRGYTIVSLSSLVRVGR